MKVLHISGSTVWGGNEQQIMDLIFELNKFNVENILLLKKDSILHKECIKQNINFIVAEKTKKDKFSVCKYLNKLLKELNPDVIHFHTSDFLTVYVFADLIYKINIPTIYSRKSMIKSESLVGKLRYNYRGLSSIICVSEKVKESLTKKMRPNNLNKIKVIYDGISESRSVENDEKLKYKYNINLDKLLIGNIANHVDAKDLGTLILAINELVNVLNVRNIHLIQIGNFSDKLTPELKSLISKYKLEEYITFTGFLGNASGYISQFEIFVMSSVREGFPLTIYESFLKKVPVVSTKAGGIPEIIIDGDNGFLTEIKDYKSLAQKMYLLLKSKKLKMDFSDSAYNIFINNYTTFHCANNTLNLYKSIVK